MGTRGADLQPPGPLAARGCAGPPSPVALAAVGWANTPLVLRSVRLLGGLALFAAGLALMLRANLGLSAWDVLHDALRAHVPLTFGQIVIVVSVAVLALSVALGVRPGAGTIANSVLVGVFADALLQMSFLEHVRTGPLPLRILVMLGGILGIALGTALYISAELGAGPRDALMLGVARRTRRSAGAARTAIEALVLVVGVVLGGSVGFGTAAFVILIGPSINIAFRLLGLESSRTKSQANIITRGARAFAAWGRAGDLVPPRETQASRMTGGRI